MEDSDATSPSSWWWRATDFYNLLWKMIIRPPRDFYDLEELGPPKFRLGKKVYVRKDLQLDGSRGMLECSHFFPAKHPVFCLDLSGSGRSGGQYISLGFHEEKDLAVVLEHLRAQPFVSSIGLWGRSMGATTAILRAAQDGELAACVLDSAFQDLRTVAEELVLKGRFPLPSFLLTWALGVVRREVSSRADFDPLELAPIKWAPGARCPAFFGVASDDTFVLPHHTQALHDAWGGERQLRVFDGGHNGLRPKLSLFVCAATATVTTAATTQQQQQQKQCLNH
ncbi:unnamed protein product [Polarella glacialis]|uniref:Xaa-Pro dipeptidyl-peptidase-like domain-containing protein n=1 Tax=Polarella glacialis TaxID=89957 RepID=A0A813KSK9_POLGL|nr:unnamed protein product [Polarella glacialis]